jgi:putative DNA methylase
MAVANGYASSPKVLDMFGGGGTIPFEASNLGADAYSIDSNELSVFIQRSILIHAQSIPPATLHKLVRSSGSRILERLKQESASLFPRRSECGTYLWSYSTACRKCNYRFYLSKRQWFSKKKGKCLGFELVNGSTSQRISFTKHKSDTAETAWVGRNGSIKCPKCGNIETADIRNCKDELVSIVSSQSGEGKTFSPDIEGAVAAEALISDTEQSALDTLHADLPQSVLPVWSGIVNPAVYGVRTHSDVLNHRQRTVLLLLIKALCEEHEWLKDTQSATIANVVISLLSGLIDQLVDWNCRLSMWIPQNEQVGRAFCGPGIPMLWDYAETDPVGNGPSNLYSKLERIIAGTAAITVSPLKCHVEHGYAQELPYPSGFFDAIVTDPPYYDNIYYSVLADFFFSWKRILLQRIEPTLFTAKGVDSSRELVASAFRCGADAHQDYCHELGLAVNEAQRVMKSDGVFALLYSHASLRGWEALVRAYRPASLYVTSVQPLSIERKQRPRAMTSDAVNTCVVFVARRGESRKTEQELGSMCERLRTLRTDLHRDLKAAGWQDEDIAVAVYAQGVGMLMNVSNVSGCVDDIEALQAFEAVVKEEFPDFKVTSRGSL